VTALTEDSNADLLGANTSQTHDTLTNNNNGDTSKRRRLDILMMLVSIYGTKELFVNEYRSLLSNRLLSLTDYETEKELLTLELLTLRFGEGTPALHNCEIMLKDISDSKRINNHIHRTTTATTIITSTTIIPSNFNATLISNLFWPSIKDEPLKLPPQIEWYY
jgi:anaphase-promoting complex subunit 2